MHTLSSETAEELRLLSTVLDRLISASSTGSVRIDQLQPLAKRLRSAVSHINVQTDAPGATPQTDAARQGSAERIHARSPHRPVGELQPHASPAQRKLGVHYGAPAAAPAAAAAGSTAVTAAVRSAEERARDRKQKGATPASCKVAEQAHQKRTQATTRVVPIRRESPPANKLLVSKEVARVFTCTLYNVLEAITTMLEATTASIFVKVGDEMDSIANVAPRLTFPPKLNRHRCQDSCDAEVLGSGIALNQRIHTSGNMSNSVLIFPVYPDGRIRTGRQSPIAVVHVENKANGKKYFDSFDETLLFFGAGLIGEIMSRVSMDWLANFFDPATQHIVAPFEPVCLTSLPLLGRTATIQSALDMDADKHAKLASRIDGFAEDVLVKRESLPHKLSEPTVRGLNVTPSLREVSTYVENVQDCWRRNASSNVSLMEDSREGQMELRTIRRELTATQQRLAECEEQLRLYQLEGSDYKQEYRDLRKELEAYVQKRDKIIM